MDCPSTSTFECATTVVRLRATPSESPKNHCTNSSEFRRKKQRNSKIKMKILPQRRHNSDYLWPTTLFLLLLSVHTVFCDIPEAPNSAEDGQKQQLISSADGGSGQRDGSSLNYVTFLVKFVDMITPKSDSASNSNFACNEVRYHYINELSDHSKTFTTINKNSIPSKAVSGDHLKICAKGFTCCTPEMEYQLTKESSKDYRRVVQDKIIGLRHTFESRASKFERFFRELLMNSRNDLHKMFFQTYGQFYSQHSEIFINLFDNLTEYYVGGRLDLNQRMFKIMNPHYSFSPDYWKCMEPMMDRLKPFGDVPQKMKQQVVRSFVAARTFSQALATGRDSILEIMKVEPVMECNSALMRMMYCPHCRGLPGLKACNNFCLNVMKGCLAHQADLDPDWNAYIDMLLQLLGRIEGPFNVESVIDGIDVKISEAIMIFQENGGEVSKKVFAGCGNPDGSSRLKRNSHDDHRFNMEELRYSAQTYNSRPRPTTAAGTNLERLSRDIREKIQPVRGFWKNLPYNLCNDKKVAAPAKRDTDCWNGVNRSRYQANLVGDGIVNQLDNPEMSLNLTEPNSAIGEQINKLRIATNRMRRAFNGRDVSWNGRKATSDRESGDKNLVDEEMEEFSGSGDQETDLEHSSSPSSVPMDTDDEDLVKQQTTSTTTEKYRPTTREPIVDHSSDDEDLDGSGSGNGAVVSMDRDWETDWENRRRPIAPPDPTRKPKFELPPIHMNTAPPESGKVNNYDEDFVIGINAENPPKKGVATNRALALSSYLLFAALLRLIVAVFMR